MADAATVLFGQFLRFSADKPLWPDRDRFVLSAGHGLCCYTVCYIFADMLIFRCKN